MSKFISIDPGKCKCGLVLADVNKKKVEKAIVLNTECLPKYIKTYSNEGETVLDNCMGSGSTGMAAVKLGRNFIGMENDKEYFKIAEERIKETVSEIASSQLTLEL